MSSARLFRPRKGLSSVIAGTPPQSTHISFLLSFLPAVPTFHGWKLSWMISCLTKATMMGINVNILLLKYAFPCVTVFVI